jgi:4-amino-4-deoxy-L-arabinose transferase-like glycosyltransferase
MRDRRGTVLLSVIVVLALLLRAADGWLASLHLDDFHSLHHARAADLRTFFAVLRQDNHPPLFFLLLRAVRALFGEQEFALRLPAILCGVATVPFVWRAARRLPGLPARVLATSLVAFSSLNLELSADLRMYSLLTLAVAGWLDAALDLLDRQGGEWRLALWTVVGLHTHYHFVHVLAVLVPTAVLIARFHPLARGGVSSLIRPLLVATALSVPWYAWGFTAQLAHGLAPGGAATSLGLLLEGLVHMVYLNLRLGGDLGRLLFLAAGGAYLALAGWSAASLLLRWRDGDRPAWLLVVVAAFLIPAWSALVVALVPRAGFEWRYIAGAVVPLALLFGHGAVAAGPLKRLRLLAAGYCVVSALALCALNVRDPGREDNRSAVRAVLARAQPGDGIVAVDWQPRLFPHSGAWNFYAPRLRQPGQELPVTIPYTDDFAFPPGTELSGFRRVFFLGRSIPGGVALLRRLHGEFVQVHEEQHGYSITLLVFERRG